MVITLCFNYIFMQRQYLRSRGLFLVLAYETAQHSGIFAAHRRLVVSAPHPDLLESHRLVQPSRGQIRRSDLEKRFLHSGGACALQQVQQDSPSEASRTKLVAD